MREYVKPTMEGEVFAANEYIAACGESGIVYNFVCDAGGGVSGKVYVETNGVEGLQTRRQWVDGWDGHWQSADRSLGGYKACGTTHAAESTDGFLDGYYVSSKTDKITPVIIWRGERGDNVHCTEELDMDKWTTQKS